MPAPARPARPTHLGDFTVTPGVLRICALAVPVGILSAGASWCLLRLIGLCTNLFFYGRLATALIAPGAGRHSTWLILCVPIAGGLIVGLMARFGSERIRGHGMPEAIEAILTRGSKVQPRVALLKPISAAISIGSGGPFGAEGPIIMTGGALGSIVAQFLDLTADQRKTLLVAGAAGGMAATFNAPLASVILAVELLLFEWRPRSFLPVVTGVVAATVTRYHILGSGEVFAVSGPTIHASLAVLLCCVAVGVACGALGAALSSLVYASEDLFGRLPIHWMWWPAIGGLIIGLGGLAQPRALGVGYDVIRQLLHGQAVVSLIVGILIVKSLIWSLSLGSGTSGGVLAPLFMIGAALGGLLGHALPAVVPGFWPLVGLAGMMGGALGVPLTAVVFPLELTGRWEAVLPLLIASAASYLFTALLLKRTILTERIARRGFHVTREYDVDPLVVLFVREVMDVEDILVYADEDDLAQVVDDYLRDGREPRSAIQRQRLYPVTAPDGSLQGIVTRRDLLTAALALKDDARHRPAAIADIATRELIVAHPDDTLSHVAYVMAETGVTRMPVVTRDAQRRLVGIITLPHLLAGRLRDLQEERESERMLHLRPWRPRSGVAPRS